MRAQHSARYGLQPGLNEQPGEHVLPGEQLGDGLAPDPVPVKVKLELARDQPLGVGQLSDCEVGLHLASRVKVDPAEEGRLGGGGP